MNTDIGSQENQEGYEYIVVGSGAGGGVVAARLAQAGCRVLLLEAGGDPKTLKGDNAIRKDALPDDYDVPVFHPFSTENEAMQWDFFVRHNSADYLQKHPDIADRDLNKVRNSNGDIDQNRVGEVWYPRAGTLGGCTAHNAMILVYPHGKDFDNIAYLTGDDSWKSENMRGYFQRMEDCRHRVFYHRWCARIGFNWSRHGYDGWLTTEKAIPNTALGDQDLVRSIFRAVRRVLHSVPNPFRRIHWWLLGHGDPNDWRLVKKDSQGVRYTPLTTRRHTRIGTREFLKQVEQDHPGNLTIELNALATEVMFDGDRAVGVRYRKGERLYRAHPDPGDDPGIEREAHASREVILCGGAFNTPQLLMLSGIGPRDELERHGIPVKVALEGVGSNLQDRYEVGIVNRMKHPWEVLDGAVYGPGDEQYRMWQTKRKGVYTSNGAVLAVLKKSRPERHLPDLFMFALLGKFHGYYPGYTREITRPNYLTWAVLKGHTNNTAGRVRLRSRDPLDTPEIDFNYFDEGTEDNGADLASVVAGIKYVRELTEPISKMIDEEEVPGKDADLEAFVKANAWGHHASCTCPIGASSSGGVLNGDFEVHGTRGLRVVDASVFPRIPGFFIVSSIYVIAEKASDVILKAAGKEPVTPIRRGDLGWRIFKRSIQVLAAILVLLVVAGIIVATWYVS